MVSRMPVCAIMTAQNIAAHAMMKDVIPYMLTSNTLRRSQVPSHHCLHAFRVGLPIGYVGWIANVSRLPSVATVGLTRVSLPCASPLAHYDAVDASFVPCLPTTVLGKTGHALVHRLSLRVCFAAFRVSMTLCYSCRHAVSAHAQAHCKSRQLLRCMHRLSIRALLPCCLTLSLLTTTTIIAQRQTTVKSFD